MYFLLRPLLFRLDPETAHQLTLRGLALAGRSRAALRLLDALFAARDARLEVEAFGLRFPNPVGLAAGYDKDGRAGLGLAALGFGHIEFGTLTPRPQPGNPRPRVFRLPEQQALINRMGFPSAGLDGFTIGAGVHARARVGINLGKNRDTPLEQAAEDYCALLGALHAQADYMTVNVSSPNTPGLRQLQSRAALDGLLSALARERSRLPRRVPLLVKIAPDLSQAEIANVLQVVSDTGFDGLIAANTTSSREGLPARWQAEAGGLSGSPLRARAVEMVRFIARETGRRLPLIGVGGVMSAQAALEMIRAGAWLIQVYTGLVYAGPGLVGGILRGLSAALDREGASRLEQLP